MSHVEICLDPCNLKHVGMFHVKIRVVPVFVCIYLWPLIHPINRGQGSLHTLNRSIYRSVLTLMNQHNSVNKHDC